MKLSEFIISYRKEHNLSARKFASMCGLSNAYISLIENEETKSPTLETLKKIATAINIDIDELISLIDDDTLISVKAMTSHNQDKEIYQSVGIDIMYAPLYDKLCCGNGGFVDDNIIEMIPIPSKGLNKQKEYFCQYAEGESMKDAGINDGDLLVFEKTDKVDYGVIGCFCTEDNVATCKKLTEMNGIMMLQPMNSDFDAIPIDPLNNNVRCIGKLKKVIKDFDWED